MSERYIASYSDESLKLSAEMRSLIERRTRPFLAHTGIDRPISVLMQEAYLQGMRDAVDAMKTKQENSI